MLSQGFRCSLKAGGSDAVSHFHPFYTLWEARGLAPTDRAGTDTVSKELFLVPSICVERNALFLSHQLLLLVN